MREIITKVYKFEELSDEAKEKARAWWCKDETFDWLIDEGADSLKGLFKAAGIRLTEWSLGAYRRDAYVSFDMGNAGELKGKRAIAWLENNLFGPLRLTRSDLLKTWREHGQTFGYRVGMVKPCPFTGVCYDDDLLIAVQNHAKNGETLSDAFKMAAEDLARTIEKEIEARQEDDAVDEMIIANENEFTEDGKPI